MIVREWLSRRRVDECARHATGLASGGFKLAEVSAQRRLRGHVGDRGGRGSSYAGSLVPEKAKQFVLSNRSTNRTAKLVPFQAIVRIREEITGIDVAVAH